MLILLKKRKLSHFSEIVTNINETRSEIEKTTNELYSLLDELVGTTLK